LEIASAAFDTKQEEEKTDVEKGCTERLHDTLHQYGAPDIYNSDQGSQYTSDEYIAALK
jgi:transposase InsO family protein